MSQKIKKVLILGSGGLKIGQAGEFDYSGSQAIKALKEEGIETIILNPNIATVQTDKNLADKVYFLPITAYFAEEVIKKEKPDGILLGFGGQTALNTGLELDATGVLEKYNVQVLGTPVKTIRDTEDRDLFKKRLDEINIKTANSHAVTDFAEAKIFAEKLGYPVMVRSAFSLGGANSGMVNNEQELKNKLEEAFKTSPQVLVEEYLKGWKEVEYEVVRDCDDNCIVVCNMENFDPMGIHTGESMVVAPSQTLNNSEYHFLREVAIKTVRHLGVVGECNIQYALDPNSSEINYRVIEVNARLSRSSALASKATGYPLAFVAAKLALGQNLTEIKNSVTKVTCACFEPALDYIVLKMPRWDLTKFQSADRRIGSEMKSVGEVMAIGRKFEEVLQKAIRMTAIGADGFTANSNGNFKIENFKEEIEHPTDRRIFAIAEALKNNVSIKEISNMSFINNWFLEKLKNIIDLEKEIKEKFNFASPGEAEFDLIKKAKQFGFCDKQISAIINQEERTVRELRKKMGINPVIKQIDTLAGEFPAQTNYLYFTYNGDTNDIEKSHHSIIVLGSGPYCIGSSVEFDWCCVQAVKTLKNKNFNTIMVNCNPETVSTDYDTADRLYFDELSLERVLDIYEFENPEGIILSTGGQIPNNLALKLSRCAINILGTKPEDIDKAEDRNKFSALLDELKIDQPLWIESTDIKKAEAAAKEFGFPVLVRPSYVLSGTAMNVVFDEEDLNKYLSQAVSISSEHPVVISKFIENSREIEIDGVAQAGDLIIYAISEHIENAGTHSGDANLVLPPQRTYLETIRRAKKITAAIIKNLKITGPFNIQFLAKENQIKVIECNLRASRSFPFVSKVVKNNFIEIAVRAIMGEKIKEKYNTIDLDYVAVKSPQFSYSRIKGADPLGYVEMSSTGEVVGFGDGYLEAFLKSIISSNTIMPDLLGEDKKKKNILISVGKDKNRIKLLPKFQELSAMNFNIYATEHTADFLNNNGVSCEKVYKVHTKQSPNVADLLAGGKLDLIINIPTHYLKRELEDGFIIRRRAVDLNIPLLTNLQIVSVFIESLASRTINDLKAKEWGEY